MTNQELDALMKRVLVDSMKLDMEAAVKNDAIAFQPSSHYQRQMQLMQRDPLKWAKKKTLPMWKHFAQKVAIILLIISLCLSALMVASPTARAAFIRWATEWYETYIIYRYSEEAIVDELPQYQITELPEGIAESGRTELPRTAFITYGDEFGDAIYFTYGFMEQGGATFFDTEDYNVFDIEIQHMSGQFLESKVSGYFNTITWVDTKRNIQFSVSGAYSYADILHIAESVSLAKTTK